MATPDVPAGTGRLPFQLRKVGATGRLALAGETVLGFVHVDRLELEVPDAATAGFDPDAPAEKYQRRRTQLVVAALRVDQRALEARVAAATAALALQGVTALTARLADGHISATARVADGLAAADLSFRVLCAPSGLGLRVVAGDVRVHGHLPTPGPVLVHRILVTVLGAVEGKRTDTPDEAGGAPLVRGLCDVELEPLPALLWRLLPGRGWRLPGTAGLALVAARISRAGLVASYAPSAPAGKDDVLGAEAAAIVLAHDAMHSADESMRKGQLDDAMRGYRALLAAGGPDQPILLSRILAAAAARPTWFVDGLELARQALARWPDYAPAHAALASISIAKGDSRDAASHLGQLAESCSDVGDDDAAALAALAAARLLRVIDPRAATAMYEQALTFYPGHAEAVDALADRYTEEARWQDLVRLHRGRLASTTDRSRAVRDRLRLADVLSGRLNDRTGARAELERARELAPDDGAVHQALADLAESSGDDAEAAAALAEVARLARERKDRHGEAHACARRAQLLDRTGDDAGADLAWTAALDLAPDDLAVMRGAARARARRGAPAAAAALWRRVLSHDLPASEAAGAALELARALGAIGDLDGARAALDDAARGPVETAADAHQLLAELLTRSEPPDARAAAGELDAAIAALITAAEQAFMLPEQRGDGPRTGDGDRMLGRAAVLAVERARLLDGVGDRDGALGDLQRAHHLAGVRAPDVARDAARALLDRTVDDAGAQRGWIDAVLATRPPDAERARLLVRRARQHRADGAIEPALADLTEALALAAAEATLDDDTHADVLAVQAEILLGRGDRQGSAKALAARAKLVRRDARAAADTDAASAWLDSEEPAAALPHASRAVRELDDDAEPAVRRRALLTLAEASWRQRAWSELALAIGELVDDDALAAADRAVLRYRGAVASEKLGEPVKARGELDAVLADDQTPADLRAHAHRLLSELCERAGDHLRAARSLEAFASDPTTGMSATVRADAWYRAAELYRRAGGEAMRGEAGAPALGDPHLDDAARCLEGALRLVEDHLPALDALELVERAMGNLERVAVILGRKIAASSRRPSRQKALLARLASLQLELGRPEVALEAYRRALELDPDDRTALRFVADHARAHDRGVAAATYERLAGAMPGDAEDDAGTVATARAGAASSLAKLVADARDTPADASWAETWLPRARAAVEATLEIAPADDELRRAADAVRGGARGLVGPPPGASPQVRAAALQRQAGEARVDGRLDLAAAHLAAAVALEPADTELLRDFAEVLSEQGDWAAYADTLDRLAGATGEARTALGPRRAEVLLELADVAYDRLADVPRARAAMRAAAEAHGPGARRDATLRLLASEAFSRGEFGEALSAYESLAPARRTGTDKVAMATAHHRLGRDATAITMLEEARATGRISDEGAMLLFALGTERKRKAELAAALEHAALTAPPSEARARLYEALTLYRDQVADSDAMARVSARLETLGGQTAAAAAAAMGLEERAEVTAVVPAPYTELPTEDDLDGAAAAAVAAALGSAEPRDPEEITAVHDFSETTEIRPPARTTGAFTAMTGSAVAAAVAVTSYDASAVTEAARSAFGKAGSAGPTVDDEWSTPQITLDTAAVARMAASAQSSAASVTRAEELERDAEAASERGEGEAAADLLADALAARVAGGASTAETLAALARLEQVAGASPDLILRALFNAAARAPVDIAVLLLRRAAVTAEQGLQDDVIAADALARAHSLARTDETVLEELTAVLTRTGDVVRLADAAERTARAASGRTAARAYHQLGLLHRDAFNDARRSAEHLAAAHKADPTFAPVWLPLASSLAADDDLEGARGLYERALADGQLADTERTWVKTQLAALDRDPDVVSGEVGMRPPGERTTDVQEVMAAVAQSLTDMMTAVATGLTEAVASVVTGELPPGPGPAATLHALDAAEDDGEAARITEPMATVSADDVISSELVPLMSDADATGELPALSEPTAPLPVVTIPPIEDDRVEPLPVTQRITEPLPVMFGPTEDEPAIVIKPAPARPRTVPPPPPQPSRRTMTAPPPWVPIATTDAPTQPVLVPPPPPAADAVPPAAPDHAALEDMYERAGDWDALTELLGQRIVAADEETTRAALWYRRAMLYRDVLHREAETYRCLREAHACLPGDPEIAHALRAVAMARGEWALAAELIYREITAATTNRDKGALHLELALVYDEKLLEPEQARVNFEQALALDDDIPAAPRPLATIYERAGRHAEAAAMFRRAAGHARPGERSALLIRAAQSFARAQDIEGARTAATDAIAAADAVGDPESARDARGELSRHAPVLERPEKRLQTAPPDERVVALENALAAAQARGDLPAADRHADALYDLDPTNGLAFRHLAAAAEDAADWPVLTALLASRAMMIVGDPAERATTWFELGRIHESRRKDASAAAAAYDRALEAAPDHPAALEARAALAYATQDWDKADSLYAKIDPARSALSREVLLLRRVSIAETRGRFDDALAIARQAAASDGASRDAFAAAVKLGLRLGDHAAAATAARAALDLMPPEDPAALAEARVELGDLLAMAGDHAGAAAVFEQVLGDDAKNQRALIALLELHTRRGQPASAAKVLRTLTGMADQPSRKAELVWRLGELQLQVGDLEAADDEFLRASDLDPSHQPTLRRLIDVYWRADEPPLLLDVCTDLHQQGQLLVELTDKLTLARALITAAMSAALKLAAGIAAYLGADAAALVAKALSELDADRKELTLTDAAAGVRELSRKGQGPKVIEICDALADLPDDAGDDAAAALTG